MFETDPREPLPLNAAPVENGAESAVGEPYAQGSDATMGAGVQDRQPSYEVVRASIYPPLQ